MSTQGEAISEEQSRERVNRSPYPNQPILKVPAASFAYPRDFLGNRFVYLTISPRARGLSIGVNLNPDRKCNFDCAYCEVDRRKPTADEVIDCDAASRELESTLSLVHAGQLRERPPYNGLPDELLKLRHVALSGDGEPTASPHFREAVETVVYVRARSLFPFFKMVLITNASHLDSPEVQAGIRFFTTQDGIWAKLEAGSQEYMGMINRSQVPLDRIQSNILLTARKRAVVIQSLFCAVNDTMPTNQEIERYAERLRELKEAGAKIPLVQIYSATRPMHNGCVRHLPLRTMGEIASTVRRISGLRAEVF